LDIVGPEQLNEGSLELPFRKSVLFLQKRHVASMRLNPWRRTLSHHFSLAA